MFLNDSAIRLMADNKTWPTSVISRSGYADHVALVIGEKHTINGRTLLTQHAEFFVFDHSADIDELGRELVAEFNNNASVGEPERTYIRSLNLGPATGHVFERTPMSNGEGELFKCGGCGMVVTGKPDFHKGSSHMSPYSLVSPDKPSVRSAYYRPCPSVRTLPAQRVNISSDHPGLF